MKVVVDGIGATDVVQEYASGKVRTALGGMREHVSEVRLVLSSGGASIDWPLVRCRATVSLRPFGTVPRAEAIDRDPSCAIDRAVDRLCRDLRFELNLRRTYRFSEMFQARGSKQEAVDAGSAVLV